MVRILLRPIVVLGVLLATWPAFAAGVLTPAAGGVSPSSGGEALFTSSGTWTVPSGVSTIVLTGCGGGGGGAGVGRRFLPFL